MAEKLPGCYPHASGTMVESAIMRPMRYAVATGLVVTLHVSINQVETVAHAVQGGEGMPYDSERCQREED